MFFKSGDSKRKRDDSKERLQILWGKQDFVMDNFTTHLESLKKTSPDFARVTRLEKDGPASLDGYVSSIVPMAVHGTI